MAKLTILTQYLENYSETKTPHWKKKGGHTFIVKDIEGDSIIYCNNMKQVCVNLISARCNEHFMYTYIDHNIEFFESEEISADLLMEEIRKNF